MKPGKELDRLVAEVMGQTDFNHPGFNWEEGSTEDGDDGWDGFYCPRCGEHESNRNVPCVKPYSTDGYKTWQAWGWLEKNNPWKDKGFCVTLGRSSGGRGEPAVLIFYYDSVSAQYHIRREIEGENYPHAIGLAVLEAKKAIG